MQPRMAAMRGRALSRRAPAPTLAAPGGFSAMGGTLVLSEGGFLWLPRPCRVPRRGGAPDGAAGRRAGEARPQARRDRVLCLSQLHERVIGACRLRSCYGL